MNKRLGRKAKAVGLAVGVAATVSACNPVDAAINMMRSSIADALELPFQQMFDNQFLSLGADQWAVGFEQAALWGGLFSLVVVAVAAVEVGLALIARNPRKIVVAGVWGVMAWSVTSASLWIFATLAGFSRQGAGVIVSSPVGVGISTGEAARLYAEIVTEAFVPPVAVPLIFLVIVMLALYLAAFAVSLVGFSIGIVQIIVAAFAPIPLMLWGFKPTSGMGKKWWQAVMATLLSGPIISGFFVLGLRLLLIVGGEHTLATMMMGIVILMISIFAPFLAWKLAGFCGMQLAAAMMTGSTLMRSASMAGRMIGKGKAGLSSLGRSGSGNMGGSGPGRRSKTTSSAGSGGGGGGGTFGRRSKSGSQIPVDAHSPADQQPGGQAAPPTTTATSPGTGEGLTTDTKATTADSPTTGNAPTDGQTGGIPVDADTDTDQGVSVDAPTGGVDGVGSGPDGLDLAVDSSGDVGVDGPHSPDPQAFQGSTISDGGGLVDSPAPGTDFAASKGGGPGHLGSAGAGGGLSAPSAPGGSAGSVLGGAGLGGPAVSAPPVPPVQSPAPGFSLAGPGAGSPLFAGSAGLGGGGGDVRVGERRNPGSPGLLPTVSGSRGSSDISHGSQTHGSQGPGGQFQGSQAQVGHMQGGQSHQSQAGPAGPGAGPGGLSGLLRGSSSPAVGGDEEQTQAEILEATQAALERRAQVAREQQGRNGS